MVMRKFISIFLLSSYLLSSTIVGELVKIPAFIEHYQEHKMEDAEMTFWDFLEIHYFNGDVADEDYEKDMQLPFKTINGNILLIGLKPEFIANPEFTLPSPNIKNALIPSYVFLFASQYLNTFWHPPQSNFKF